MREKLETVSLVELRKLAKVRGVKKITSLKKSELIDAILATVEEEDTKEAPKKQEAKPETKTVVKVENKSTPVKAVFKAENVQDSRTIGRRSAKKAAAEAAGSTPRPIVINDYEYETSAETPAGPVSHGGYTNTLARGRGENNEKAVNKASSTMKTSSDASLNVPMGHPYSEETAVIVNADSVSEVGKRRGRPRKEQDFEDVVEETRESLDNEARDVNEGAEGGNAVTVDPNLDSGIRAYGILEVMSEGYGFIRCDNYLPGTDDVYVSPSQIRKFGLKTGDILDGTTRVKTQNEKFAALLYLYKINGFTPEKAATRANFEDLTPIFPNERLHLSSVSSSNNEVAMRIVDLISPIGKGQRGLIVAPPKAGKTTLLKQTAKAITSGNPNMRVIILLIDERPEEVTDMKEAIEAPNVEVIYSTFDELPEHHRRVSEMVIERAKRLVEHGLDVTILLDSITRLTRAYNMTIPASGRTLSGGLDPAALHMPKKFFGAARNMREGGSLTILATALVDTGSKMDDVVFEEFKGTGNMELILDRKLSEKRIFPAIDITGSGTRREDLLLTRKELDAMEIMRKAINGARKEDAVETILNMFAHTKNNDEYIDMIIRKRVI